VSLQNRLVNFRIADVYFPDPTEVLLQLHASDVLQGRVVDTSDGGKQAEAFVVVRVDGLEQPVIVSTRKLIDVL
jgi:hypothetical protein